MKHRARNVGFTERALTHSAVHSLTGVVLASMIVKCCARCTHGAFPLAGTVSNN